MLYLQQLYPIFQHDDAGPHIAAVNTRFLRVAQVTVLRLPARSLDLSPIEYIWFLIGTRKLGQLCNMCHVFSFSVLYAL